MPKRLVMIEWDTPDYEGWLADDNISYALHSACPNTTFKVEGFPELFQNNVHVDWALPASERTVHAKIDNGSKTTFDEWWLIHKFELLQDENIGIREIARAGFDFGCTQKGE